MKKTTLLLLFILLVSGWHVAYDTKARTDDQALSDIARVMQTSGIALDEWQIRAKSNDVTVTTEAEYDALIAQLKKQLPSFSWTEPTRNDQFVRTSAVKHAKNKNITEKLTVIFYQQGHANKTVLLYDMLGKKWNQAIETAAFALLSDRTTDLFTKKPLIFSCAHGKMDDKIGHVLYEKANEIMNALDASLVEQLKEETFVSLSAYTTLWNGSLLANGTKMNLQIALRNVGATDVTVSIGTPILMDEY